MGGFFRRHRGARAKAAFAPEAVRPLEGRTLLSADVTRFAFPDDAIGALAAGPDGKVWFADRRTVGGADVTAIGRLSPSGAVDRIALPARVDGVHALALGIDGNVWFGGTETTATAGVDAGVIGRVTAAGSVTLFDVPGVGSVDRLVRGPDEVLEFTTSTTTAGVTEIGLGLVGPTGAVVRLPVAFRDATTTSFLDNPGASGLAVDRLGNTWASFAQSVGSSGTVGRLARVTPDRKVTVYTLPVVHLKPGHGSPPVAAPFTVQGMTTGPDGNVWATESTGDYRLPRRVVRVTPFGRFTRFPAVKGGSQAQPDEITAGPGGTLDFSVRDVNSDVPAPQHKLGVVTRRGRVSFIFLSLDTHKPTGLPGVSADGPLTVGPDGNVYFVNDHFGTGGGQEIDRLNLPQAGLPPPWRRV